MKTAYVITMTLLGTVTATPDISSFLFPPNLNPDASLLEHAGRLSVRNPSITLEGLFVCAIHCEETMVSFDFIFDHVQIPRSESR